MQPVFQSVKTNSLVACVASVLEVDVNSLPPFDLSGDWLDELIDWCGEAGFSVITWNPQHNPLVLTTSSYIIALLTVEGEETLKAVLAKSKLIPVEDEHGYRAVLEIIHDPVANNSGKVERVLSYVFIGKQ